jgi:hypothetical protein
VQRGGIVTQRAQFGLHALDAVSWRIEALVCFLASAVAPSHESKTDSVLS